MERQTIAVEWSIRGYNVYRRKPHTDINMYLMPEPDNVYDRNTFKVMMPAIHRIPSILRDLRTDDDQTVRDIAGEIIGRVPQKLCLICRRLLDENLLLTSDDIICIFRGLSVANELECVYQLCLPKRRFREAMHVFEDIMTQDELNEKLFC